MYRDVFDLIDHFTRMQRSREEDTSDFANQKHNRDLLPRLQERVENILYAYGTFHPIVYDIQGPSDAGADVLVVLRPRAEDQGGQVKTIGFQVKSDNEIGNKKTLSLLKAQRDDSFRKIDGLTAYYILLCADMRSHRERVRLITSEFRTADRTVVVEPTFAHHLLNLPLRRIEGIVSRAHQAEDVVFQKAIDVFNRVSSYSAGALLAYIALWIIFDGGSLTLRDIQEDSSLHGFYEDLAEEVDDAIAVADRGETQKVVSRGTQRVDSDGILIAEPMGDFEEALATDLELLDGNVIDMDTSSDGIKVIREEILPIVAVLSDAVLRYDLDRQQSLEYAYNLFGLES